MTKNRAYASAALVLCLATTVAAQEEHQHHHPVNEQIGDVRFRTSCSPPAQRQFKRAVAWLHSFEYDEAARAFQEVERLDSTCGMAQWGVAMSFHHPLWAPPTRDELARGRSAAERASALGAGTPREREYIDAIGSFYRNYENLDHPTRAAAYERAMQSIYKRYPGDIEAGIFYALALNSTALTKSPIDKTYTKQKQAAEILNRVLRFAPRHPGVAHYLIHSYDYPQLARFALAAARQYSKIAPSSAHALHMPSHIFTRLGYWDDAIASNLRSEAAAKSYAARNHLKGAWDEQLHAMDYLAYAYLQRGRDKEARVVLAQLKAIRKTDPENFKCAYSFAAIPARWALERRQWTDAADLTVQPADFPWARFRPGEAITWFARAIGAARAGRIEQARADVEKLAALQQEIASVRDGYDWATQVAVQHKAAAAWVAKAEGQTERARQLMQSAADLEDSTDKHPVTPGAVVPARELLGEMLLELNQPAEAFREFVKSLAESPNRLNALYGAARAAELAGDSRNAAHYYQKLVAQSVATEDQRPEVKRARAYLGSRAMGR
jgi:tetratricopeptide (TPR) repeat protein